MATSTSNETSSSQIHFPHNFSSSPTNHLESANVTSSTSKSNTNQLQQAQADGDKASGSSEGAAAGTEGRQKANKSGNKGGVVGGSTTAATVNTNPSQSRQTGVGNGIEAASAKQIKDGSTHESGGSSEGGSGGGSKGKASHVSSSAGGSGGVGGGGSGAGGNKASSQIKPRGETSPYSSRGGGYGSLYHQQQASQSSLIQNAGLAYPYLYPSSFHMGGFPGGGVGNYNYPGASSSASTGASGSVGGGRGSGSLSRGAHSRETNGGGNSTSQGGGGVGSSSGGSAAASGSQSTTGGNGGNSRRGGKKKAPAAQAQNPEFRLFFNLRRRDSTQQANKGPQHVYKPKNPPSLFEWFKRLSVEERVNSLSTVCPHLTEIFINMYQRSDGSSSFARIGPHSSQDHKYYSQASPYLPHHPHHLAHHGYGFGFFPHSEAQVLGLAPSSSYSASTTFDEMFYHRTSGDIELSSLRNSDRVKIEAENEILKHVRLTDYFSCLDTLTVSEDLVIEPELFFKLMQIATGNQALQTPCHFEIKAPASGMSSSVISLSSATVIEQPTWFKPKTFHTFSTWVIVALEENLWAHYNFDNNLNLGSGTKLNDLVGLFREKTDCGTQDVDLEQLVSFWRETSEKDRKGLIDTFKTQALKEFGESDNSQSAQAGGSIRHQKISSSTKGVSYSLQIKDRTAERSSSNQIDQQCQRDSDLKTLVDLGIKTGSEYQLLRSVMFTSFDQSGQRQVSISRKLLELIKKKYKDDLMENLLMEEYSKAPTSNGTTNKGMKKKKKKTTQASQPSEEAFNNSADTILGPTLDSSLSTNAPATTAAVAVSGGQKKKKKVVTLEASAAQSVADKGKQVNSSGGKGGQGNKGGKKKKAATKSNNAAPKADCVPEEEKVAGNEGAELSAEDKMIMEEIEEIESQAENTSVQNVVKPNNSSLSLTQSFSGQSRDSVNQRLGKPFFASQNFDQHSSLQSDITAASSTKAELPQSSPMSLALKSEETCVTTSSSVPSVNVHQVKKDTGKKGTGGKTSNAKGVSSVSQGDALSKATTKAAIEVLNDQCQEKVYASSKVELTLKEAVDFEKHEGGQSKNQEQQLKGCIDLKLESDQMAKNSIIAQEKEASQTSVAPLMIAIQASSSSSQVSKSGSSKGTSLERHEKRGNSNSSEEQEKIRNYLIELTNMMIAEVCRRVETASPSPQGRDLSQKSSPLKQTDLKPLIMSSLGPDVKEESKIQTESLARRISDRRISLTNMKGSFDEKNFSSVHQINSTNHFESNIEGVRKFSGSENSKTSQPQRRGFGIHLKGGSTEESKNQGSANIQGTTVSMSASGLGMRKDSHASAGAGSSHQFKDTDSQEAWAKGTARQAEQQTKQQRKAHQPAKKVENNQGDKQSDQKKQQAPSVDKSNKEMLPQVSDTKKQNAKFNHPHQSAPKPPPAGAGPSSKPQPSALEKPAAADDTQPKKKRNKKKASKLTDTDIMNQFMKSLHSHADEETEKQPSFNISGNSRQYQNNQKKPYSNQQGVQRQPNFGYPRKQVVPAQQKEEAKGQKPAEKDIDTDPVSEQPNEEGKLAIQEANNSQSEQDKVNPEEGKQSAAEESVKKSEGKPKINSKNYHGYLHNKHQQLNNDPQIQNPAGLKQGDSQATRGQIIRAHHQQPRRYTEDQTSSMQPLHHHHLHNDNGNPSTDAPMNDCSQSHDGSGAPQGKRIKHIQNKQKKPHPKQGVEKQEVHLSQDCESTAEQKEPNFASALNLNSAPFVVSVPQTVAVVNDSASEFEDSGKEGFQESTLIREASVENGGEEGICGIQTQQQHKNNTQHNTPMKQMNAESKSFKPSVVSTFTYNEPQSEGVEAAADFDKGASKSQSFRTPPQSCKKTTGSQSNYSQNASVSCGQDSNPQNISAHGMNMNNSFKKAQLNQSASQIQFKNDQTSASDPQNQPSLTQSMNSNFQNTKFVMPFMPVPPQMQSTYGGISYHPFNQSPFYNGLEMPQAFPPANVPYFTGQPPQGSYTPPPFGGASAYPGNFYQYQQPLIQTPVPHMNQQYRLNPTTINRSQNNQKHPSYHRPHHTKGSTGPHSARNLNQSSASSSSGGNSNVFIQPMNISQSMQEQQQQMMQQLNQQLPEHTQIFLQDQNQLGNFPLDNQLQKNNSENVFSYIEKSHSYTFNTQVPSFSPSHNQNTAAPFSPMTPGDFAGGAQPAASASAQVNPSANPFSYQRAHSVVNPNQQQVDQQQQHYDQSQDLIFKIFNSIKSNHSMSPIPQITSPPALMLDYQLSQSSELVNHQMRMESQYSGAYHQETQFFDKLDQDINSYIKEIEDNLCLLKPERDHVLSKIQDVAQQVFKGESPKLELFGSLVTGLALESSDMDLAVTGLRIDDRYEMITNLKNLASGLQDLKCLETFKAIETASIPVIKMKIDLVKYREQEMMIEIEESEKRPIPENQRYLSVDITFDDSPVHAYKYHNLGQSMIMSPDAMHHSFYDNQPKTHLGLQSCSLVQRYIQDYKSLKQVAILMKQFLSIHNFNSPYYGGLSSYSTVILIVAYMNYHGLKNYQQANQFMYGAPAGPYGMMMMPPPMYHQQQLEELSPSQLLMGFLDFYGNQFNPGTMGINVIDDGSFFHVQSLSDSANFTILDPLNLTNNTTKNSYLTRDILNKFQAAFNNLRDIITQFPNVPPADCLYQTLMRPQPLVSSPNCEGERCEKIDLGKVTGQESSSHQQERITPREISNSSSSNKCLQEPKQELVQGSQNDSKLAVKGNSLVFNERFYEGNAQSLQQAEEDQVQAREELQTSQTANKEKSPAQCYGVDASHTPDSLLIAPQLAAAAGDIHAFSHCRSQLDENLPQHVSAGLQASINNSCTAAAPIFNTNLLDIFFTKELTSPSAVQVNYLSPQSSGGCSNRAAI